LHPGSRILIYVLAALVIPGLSFFLLFILLLAALGTIARTGRRPFRLLWRTRWLLLVLLLGYGFGEPGDAVGSVMGDWAPTWPGLALGVEHAARLVVLYLWLDVLVLALTPAQMLSGLHALLGPLMAIGVDTERVALRIALTLKAIESLEQERRRGVAGRVGGNLRGLFDPAPNPLVPDRVMLVRHPLRYRDVLIPLLVGGGAVVLWALDLGGH